MPDIVGDGNIRIAWLTAAPSNLNAPTVAEIGGGVDLTPLLTPDGWNVATSEAEVDNSALNSVDDTRLPGRRADDIETTFKHQGDSAAPWTTFSGRPAGYLVERTSVPYATAWAAGQKVRIFPVTAGNRNKLPRTPNELEKFAVKHYKSAAVIDQATVA
jgi:hypothetical protein